MSVCTRLMLSTGFATTKTTNLEFPVKKYKFDFKSSPEGVDLVRRLGLSTNDPKTVHDATCGLHSNVPECCVAFYLMMINEVMKIEGLVKSAYFNSVITSVDTPQLRILSILQRVSSYGAEPLHYYRCPGCIAANRYAALEPCSCYDKMHRRARERYIADTELNRTAAKSHGGRVCTSCDFTLGAEDDICPVCGSDVLDDTKVEND